MSKARVLKFFRAATTCLALAMPAAGVAQVLSPAQLLKPEDLTPKELAFYQKTSDPEVVKNFIITRSYVRPCQKVNDQKMPAQQLPDKPLGFTAHYLLSGEATMINTAISASIVATCKTNPKGCFGGK